MLFNKDMEIYGMDLENQNFFSEFLYLEKKILIKKNNEGNQEIKFYSRKINKEIIMHCCIFLSSMIFFSSHIVKYIPLIILFYVIFLLNIMRTFKIFYIGMD